jgi:hypothetical protein
LKGTWLIASAHENQQNPRTQHFPSTVDFFTLAL